jgi:hypothetical protein
VLAVSEEEAVVVVRAFLEGGGGPASFMVALAGALSRTTTTGRMDYNPWKAPLGSPSSFTTAGAAKSNATTLLARGDQDRRSFPRPVSDGPPLTEFDQLHGRSESETATGRRDCNDPDCCRNNNSVDVVVVRHPR